MIITHKTKRIIILLFFLIFFSHIPALRFKGAVVVNILITSIIYYSIHTTKQSVLTLATIGTYNDLMASLPLGLSLIQYLSMWFISNQYNKLINNAKLYSIAIIFAIVTLINLVLRILIVHIYGCAVSIPYLEFEVVASIVTYPILHYIYEHYFNNQIIMNNA